MARRKKIVENLTVHGIADKGMAVARDPNGMVYFVKGAVPGDVIDLLVLRKKKGFKTGIVNRLVTPSPKRTTPFCAHFGTCGGCKWQQLSYEDQLHYKQQNVEAAIQRIAKLDATIVKPVMGSALTTLYRNKLEYSFSTKCWLTEEQINSGEKNLQKPALGFHAPGTYDKIIDIQTCHLQDDLTNEIRNFIRLKANEKELSYYDFRTQSGMLRNIVVRNTTLGQWMVNIVFGANEMEGINYLMEAVKEKFSQITSLFYTINLKNNDTILDQKIITYHGPGYIVEQLGDLKFKIGPKSFFQTNSTQAKVLYDEVVKMADFSGEENVYDLYTGTGSIALYLAKYCKHITGIETVKEAIDDAHYNKELNQIENADFVVGDVKEMLDANFIKRFGPADVIITDPPRAGMHPTVVETLLKIGAKKIVYVSCNPATQARDLMLLSEKYETTGVQPVDMFPHTSHIESIALLKLKS